MSRNNCNTTPTPSQYKSMRTNKATTPLKPILKQSPPIIKDVGTWTTPSRKQSVSSVETVVEKRLPPMPTIKSLSTIRQTFSDEKLPWDQYNTQQTITDAVSCQTPYDEMMTELNISHAYMTASQFKTLTFDEADKLLKKFNQLKGALDSMYDQIRVQTEYAKATVLTLKLNAPKKLEFCQLGQCALQLEELLEEFYFTSKYANYIESNYLKHLAGTLCIKTSTETAVVKVEDDHSSEFKSILVKLKAILHNTEDESEEVVSLSSSSSSSSASSMSSASSRLSRYSRKSSACTSLTTLDTNLQAQIDAVIDRVSRQLRQNKEVIQLLQLQSKNSATLDELVKQRERSAQLVLQLENHRSSSEKREAEKIMQCLQSRVANLEEELKTKDKMIENSNVEIEVLRNKLRKKQDLENTIKSQCTGRVDDQGDVQQLVQTLVGNQGRLNDLNQIKQDQKSWINTKQNILNHCYIITQQEETDVEKAVQLALSTTTLHSSSNKEIFQNNDLLQTDPKQDTLQVELTKQRQMYNEAIKAFTARESAYILQSASTEAELERILKEYDRVTRNITDFNKERQKFEQEIRQLYLDKVSLSKQLSDEQIRHIESFDSTALRKEFRDMMASVKVKHAQELVKELDMRRKVEHALRDKMSEIEMKRWEKVDIAVQTPFCLRE